jgi:hypothetical protein
MADDTQRPLEERRISGVVSGFDKYSTTSDSPDQATSPHEYTLIDFYNQLRDLLSLLDKVQLERIENLINSHIFNYANPHRDTLESLGIDILNSLYQLWLGTHPTTPELTYEFFIKLLFQFVEIASVDETLRNTAPNKLISVLDLIKLIEKHNNDPNAHEVLKERLMPGEAIDATPISAWHSFYSLPRSQTIELPYTAIQVTDLLDQLYVVSVHDHINNYYIQSDRKLHKLNADDIPIEWIGDHPYWSLWNTTTNQFIHSEDFSTWNTTGIIPSIFSNDSPNVDILDSYWLQEIQGTDDIIHGVTSSETLSVSENQVVTVSVFFKKTSTTRPYSFISFNHSTLDSTYMFAQYDLTINKPQVFQTHPDLSHLDSHAHMVRLANGWYRCIYTLKFAEAGDITITLGSLDHFGGDLIYHNDTTDPYGILLYGAQVEYATSASPYMRTTGDSITRSINSCIWIPVYNYVKFGIDEGTLVTNYLNNNIIADPSWIEYALVQYAYPNGISILKSSQRSLNTRYILNQTFTNSLSNNVITNTEIKNLEPHTLIKSAITFKKFTDVSAYVTDYHSTGYDTITYTTADAKLDGYRAGTFNPHIVLGSMIENNSSQGYIQSVVYYPTYLSANRIKSLIDYIGV